ncbi:MAG: aspartate aminotransferase family protein [bacterium]
MDTKKVKVMDKEYIGNTYKRYDVVFEKGAGSYLYDKSGKKYLDFFAGVAVNALGHNNKAINTAIIKQLKKYIHLSNWFYTEAQAELAKVIVDNSFGTKVFFVNTGAEANEVAMKMARKWGLLHKKGANKIITFYNSFHGRTMAALSATAQEKFHKYLNPVSPGFVYAKFNDLNDVKAKIDNETVAMLIEPVQAEGGIFTPEPGFLEGLRELCDKNNILLIYDEVQSGLGRLGKKFGYDVYGVKPDIMTLAKSLGGGLPLSAVVIDKKLEEVYTFGDHGTTMGGNPAACAAGLVVLKTVLKPAFLKEVYSKGEYIIKQIKKWKNPKIQEIRGTGLLIGLQLKEGAADIVAAALKAGLIINVTGKETIRLEPPLNIKKTEIDKGLAILKKIMA